MGLSLGLYSAAGIPPLAGFFAKWLVIYEALNNDLYFLALIAVITSTIALVYYIRITKWLYFKDSEDYNMKIMLDTIKSNENISVALTLILGFSLFLILTILIYPMLLIKFANYLLILSLV
jgi:NADH:ubiquinone oxidoreductase subunit 2 (subunit N)